jgi:hypothetical protein
MEMWRLIAMYVIMFVSATDLLATYYYIYTYKKWQPNKPYELMELNPLLRYLWKNFGLHIGMFIGTVIILSLNYVVCKHAHWGIVVLLGCLLGLAMFNHFKNINLLHKLIQQYPTGHLPEAIFGKVVGNNPFESNKNTLIKQKEVING